MQKKIVRPTPKWKFLLCIVGALVFLYAATLIFSALCTPKLQDHGKQYTKEQIARTQAICRRPVSCLIFKGHFTSS